MGAIAGLYAFGHVALSPRETDPIEATIARFGCAGALKLPSQSVAVVSRFQHTPREERECGYSALPGVAACAWNGRIDNRRDLMTALTSLAPGTSDADLAVAVFGEYGVDGLRLIVGDWTGAFWDQRRQQLVLARDYYGARPLFYRCDASALAWSSSLAALVQRTSAYEDLDDRYIARDLMGLNISDHTPYRGLMPVSAGSALIWSSDGTCTSVEIWRPADRHVRCRDVHDYGHELRRLFAESVQQRLCYRGAAWAELSGGLDSSAIVCMADRLIRGGEVAADHLNTVSFYASGIPGFDERSHVRVVLEEARCRAHYVNYEDHVGTQCPEWGWVTPAQRTAANLAVCRLAKGNGATTLLTGNGGDQVMGNITCDGYDVAAHLGMFRVAAALRTARLVARDRRSLVYGLLADALSILGGGRWAQRRQMRQRLEPLGATEGTIDRRVRETFLISAPYAPLWMEAIQREVSSRAAAANFEKARLLSALRSDETSRGFHEYEGIVGSHPMTHRPLVEFVLAIPNDIWRPAGQARGLMRSAFASFLPERIVNRRTKGNPTAALLREAGVLAADWLRNFDRLKVVQRGFVDPDLLKAKLVGLTRGACGQLMPLPRLMRMEAWLVARGLQIALLRNANTERR